MVLWVSARPGRNNGVLLGAGSVVILVINATGALKLVVAQVTIRKPGVGLMAAAGLQSLAHRFEGRIVLKPGTERQPGLWA